MLVYGWNAMHTKSWIHSLCHIYIYIYLTQASFIMTVHHRVDAKIGHIYNSRRFSANYITLYTYIELLWMCGCVFRGSLCILHTGYLLLYRLNIYYFICFLFRGTILYTHTYYKANITKKKKKNFIWICDRVQMARAT